MVLAKPAAGPCERGMDDRESRARGQEDIGRTISQTSFMGKTMPATNLGGALTLELTTAAAELPPLLTCEQAAKFAHVCKRSIRRWIRAGRLKAGKTHPGRNGKIVVPKTALVALLSGGGPI